MRTVAGDYHEGDLGDAMNKQPLVADIVETWLKHGVGRPTLCFAVNRAHAQHIADRFAEHGVRAGYVDCFTPANERTDIRNKFASGEYQIVCNVGVLTLGVDWDVRCIILARPTKSEMLYVQIIGRGLRTVEGKDHCLILDHSDTTLRLGFVTEIHHDELDDGKTRKSHKRDGIKLPKEATAVVPMTYQFPLERKGHHRDVGDATGRGARRLPETLVSRRQLSQRAPFEFDASEPNVFNDATHLDLVAFIPVNNCAIGATWQVAVDRTKIDAGRFTNHVLRYTRESHSGGEQPPDVLVSEPRFILPVGRDHGRDVSLREAISQNRWRCVRAPFTSFLL